YARDRERCKFRRAFTDKLGTTSTVERYDQLELADGARRALTPEEKANPEIIPQGARRYQLDNLTSTRPPGNFPVLFNGREYRPRSGYWKTGPAGMQRLIEQRRVVATEGGTLRYVRYLTDFPLAEVDTLWTDISGAVQSRSDPKVYAVQTSTQVVQRCLSMTTDPGDLILDPTCGSGTTAYSAEQWARRWITIDASRVPLALARQRLLTATFHYYRLKEPERGPAGGFSYVRKQNSRGEEIGGVIPHIQLQTIANREPPKEEVLVDRPEVDSGITRVTGPFWFEATIPTPVDWDGDGIDDSGFSAESYSSFIDRMLEVLRRSPILHLGGGKRIELTQLRKPAKTLSLSAEALAIGTNVRREERKQLPPDEPVVGDPSETYGESKAVAIVFGPENGSISEKLVYEAAREAHAKSFHHLYVIGFAIQPNARALVEKCDQVVGVAATYVQATPDLMMGDLLKNMRSSQIFSVCGLPEVGVRRHASEPRSEPHYQVELLGLDVFDPATMNVDHQDGRNVPAWLLDTDYNGLCFHVCQAFFPRTSAWDDLKRSLKGEFEDSVWEHLAGTTSAPFEAGEHGQIAVKVIDDRGNELLVVKQLSEASE
ncbi:MAG TPA: DNA methyltransferase, partial [Terriglobales bacterium]|nr:DNA methyltransferase [Terriglobales bacterium]